MLKRKVYKELLLWKNNKDNKCLLIKGARQVGKTYIVEEFGRNEYESFIKMDFISNRNYSTIFEGELSEETILNNISLLNSNYKIINGKTLIFLDEIQECPNARTALKYLATSKRVDVIASGSLLGLTFKSEPSIPVGYEKQIRMYPLDFEEYLWAKGYDENQLSSLKTLFEQKEKINPAVNEKFMALLREYMVVGGMPNVVNSFISDGNFGEVHQKQIDLLDSYYDDISRYAEGYEKPKVLKCYDSIPSQLAKENKKFQYSFVEKGSSARKYGNSIDWLKNANLVNLCVNANALQFPLVAYEVEDYFKVYMSDIGLLIAKYGFEMKNAIINDTLSGPAKGGIYENLIATQLIAKGYKLRYFKSQNSDIEIEFMIEKDSKLVPIEVKANNGSSKSLNEVLKNDVTDFGYKFINGNVGVVDKKISLPLYMVMFV